MNTELIEKCAERAVRMFPYCQKDDFINDLTGCIEGGCDLDLAKLLDADDSTFCHDIVGIANNLHPTTKKLINNFIPIFTSTKK